VSKPKKRGAPPGNRNRFKTGRHSDRNCALRHDVAQLKRATRRTIALAETALRARRGGEPGSE
jgi:hypothetical protein